MRALHVVCLTPIAAACGKPPATGRPRLTSSESQEVAMGREADEEVAQIGGTSS
jgi:hypothetical protein